MSAQEVLVVSAKKSAVRRQLACSALLVRRFLS